MHVFHIVLCYYGLFVSVMVMVVQVVYPVTNPKYPIPEHLRRLNEEEAKFMADYYNRTGVHWRHYFGADGPRGPPILHMWRTERLGDTFNVTSSHGNWYKTRCI